jgi:hypothetical protein
VAPDRTETLPAPGDCSGCGEDLSDAADAGLSWAQVWDLPPITLEKVLAASQGVSDGDRGPGSSLPR